jgi:hypothetical protein
VTFNTMNRNHTMKRSKLVLSLALLIFACSGAAAHATSGPAGSNAWFLDAYDAKADGYAGPISTKTLPEGTKWVAEVQGNFTYYSSDFYYWPRPPYPQVCGDYDQQQFYSDHASWIDKAAGMDAEFVYGRPGWPELCNHIFWPIHWTNFQVNTSNNNRPASWWHPAPLGAPAKPTPDHKYSYPLLGQGHAARFRLRDLPNIWDNSGKVKIKVRRATGSDCAYDGFVRLGYADIVSCRAGLGGQ